MTLDFFFLTGLAAMISAFGTLVGFGGGVFMIPILIIVFKIPMPLAVGAVVTGLLPAALITTFFNFREKTIDPFAGLWLEVPTVVGAVIGAYLTAVLPVLILELIFAAFVLITGFQMLKPAPAQKLPNRIFARLNKVGPVLERHKAGVTYRIGAASAALFGLVAGLLSGIFGIGGGFLKTPIMIRVFRMPPSVAVATALFMIVFTSLTSLISHYSLGHVKFDYALPVIIGFSMGAFIGYPLKKRFNEAHTERLIGGGLILAGLSTGMYALYSLYP